MRDEVSRLEKLIELKKIELQILIAKSSLSFKEADEFLHRIKGVTLD